MATRDFECIFSCFSLGGLDSSPSPFTRLNFTFIDEDLAFRVLSVRCKSMGVVVNWCDTLIKLANMTVDDLEGNWDQLKGKIFYLRVRDGKEIIGILSSDRRNILKIKSEVRYDK